MEDKKLWAKIQYIIISLTPNPTSLSSQYSFPLSFTHIFIYPLSKTTASITVVLSSNIQN